jgi:hypothetical protein
VNNVFKWSVFAHSYRQTDHSSLQTGYLSKFQCFGDLWHQICSILNESKKNIFMKKKVELKKLKLNKERIHSLTVHQKEEIYGGLDNMAAGAAFSKMDPCVNSKTLKPPTK